MRQLRTAMTIAAITLSLAACAGKQNADQASGSQTRNEDEQALYALGAMVSRNVASFDLTEEEVKHVQAGFVDGALKRDVGDLYAHVEKLQELQNSRVAAAAEKEKKAGEAYLAKAAAEEGAQQTPSGLVYKEITAGTGPSPKATDVVKVHYHGTLQDGTVFDSSVERNEPATFPLGGVIPCWTEGVQMMKVGGKSRLVCPSATAYGDRGAPPDIKPGATLIFDVELLGIESGQG
jgi:FKBP-type peptidyl-prolyl cis-trans isomerase FkpA